MRLDQALVARGLCASRQEAQELIAQGSVTVNGNPTSKQSSTVLEGDALVVTARRKFVSRGGEKLEGAFLNVFGDEASVTKALLGGSALDVGSSTGGFTDCMLSYGIAHVDAVDVGTLQFHPKLKSDKRVDLYETTDIRNFESPKSYDVIVADLSFISLKSIFSKILSFGKRGALYFLLIKPQFEVGKNNTKKGIVKDQRLVERVLEDYRLLAAESGMNNVRIFPCHLRGGDGNQEYFLYAEK